MNSLQLQIPLIVAPMAGGPSSVDLITATCEAGALGSIGAAYLKPQAIQEIADQIRARTTRPFSINLFIPRNLAPVSDAQLSLALKETKKFRDELHLPPPKLEPPYEENFSEQFEAVLRIRPSVFSFIFGLLPSDFLKEARRAGIYLMGTATNVDEAFRLEESGVDAVIAQGTEAGGHHGIFDPQAADPNLKTIDLLREIKAKVKLPLIAAGGIMNSHDIKNALRAGAEAVQMGTAFLATKEAGTSAAYLAKLLEKTPRKTHLTRAFSGRLARGIENRFMIEMDRRPEAILPFPAQNKWTRDLRGTGSADFLSLWSGTGAGELWTGSAADLIHELFKPTN